MSAFMEEKEAKGLMMTPSISKKLLSARENHFNSIKYKSNQDLLFYMPLKYKNEDKRNELQAKEPLRKVVSFAGNYSQGLISGEPIPISTTTNASDSTVSNSFRNVMILPIIIRNKVNESIFKRGITKQKKNFKVCATDREAHLPRPLFINNKKRDDAKEKAKGKVSTLNVKNINSKDKVIQSDAEITISINIKDKQIDNHEGRNRNKRERSLSCGLYQTNDIPANNNNKSQKQYRLTNQIKSNFESIQQYSIDLLSMKQTIYFFNNINNHSRPSINPSSSPRRYPIYFLPNLAQGLLEETIK